MVEPFKKRHGREVITKASKFYLFDVGVAGFITKRHLLEERGELFGKAFEHFIFMEISAYKSYRDLDFDINFWRTKSGIEVDFILGKGKIAIEIKGSNNIKKSDLKSLAAFSREHSPQKSILVCNIGQERLSGNIRIIPWKQFLNDLWEGKILQ